MTTVTQIQSEITELTDSYLRYMEDIEEASLETIKPRRSHLGKFMRYFGESDIRQLTNADMDSYFIHLKRYISPLTGRRLDMGTINNHKRSVKMFLRWCLREISLQIKIDDIRIKREADKHVELVDFNDIDYVISRIPVRQDQLMIRLVYEAGLRISELAKVQLEHFRGTKLEVIGKGSRRRTTFISEELLRDLKEWMYDKGWDRGYLFRSTSYKRSEGYKHMDTVRQRIKKWFKRILGLEIVPHQLRHAFGRRLLEAGCSLRAIQKLLGHANIQTTMIYLGVDDSWLEKEYFQAINQTRQANISATY